MQPLNLDLEETNAPLPNAIHFVADWVTFVGAGGEDNDGFTGSLDD
jgi:hypothetical protein